MNLNRVQLFVNKHKKMEMELIGPGRKTIYYEIDLTKLYNLSKKYTNAEGNLLICYVFEDFN